MYHRAPNAGPGNPIAIGEEQQMLALITADIIHIRSDARREDGQAAPNQLFDRREAPFSTTISPARGAPDSEDPSASLVSVYAFLTLVSVSLTEV